MKGKLENKELCLTISCKLIVISPNILRNCSVQMTEVRNTGALQQLELVVSEFQWHIFLGCKEGIKKEDLAGEQAHVCVVQVVAQHGGEVVDRYDPHHVTHLLALHKKSDIFSQVNSSLSLFYFRWCRVDWEGGWEWLEGGMEGGSEGARKGRERRSSSLGLKMYCSSSM